MGTEVITFLYIAFYTSISQNVKLNNPLMGTEVINMNSFIVFLVIKNVKLNNPLMGTEVLYILNIHFCTFTINVKLNNPLMGTEVRIFQRSNSIRYFYWLN